MAIYLETDEIYLRDFEESDDQFIKELDSDPEVVRYISNGIPSDDNEVKRAMGIFLDFKKKHAGKYGFWVAVDKKTQNLAGWFHLRPLKFDWENFNKLELGYRLKKEFWGKGIATEVSKLLINKAFKVLDADEVWAHAMKANSSSINVMKKCGLKFDREEQYLDFPGPDKACVWYVLKKPS